MRLAQNHNETVVKGLFRYGRRFVAALSFVALVVVLVVPAAVGAGAPSIAFNPSSWDYGPIDSGTTAAKTFVLTNSGGTATRALSVSLSGSSAFSRGADTCTAVSLGPRKACSVTVQYAPTVDGSSDTGTLRASSKKSTALAVVSLSGASTAPALAASVTPNPDTIATATLGVPVARSYTLKNLSAAFTGRAVGTTLGSARLGSFTIADGAEQQFPLDVTPGSTSLSAKIGGASDTAADLDLFVFNCTTGTCVLAGQSAGASAEESVTIANPAGGAWVVSVDAVAVPAGTTSYNYLDVFVNPAFGSVSITDANALRPVGSSWTVPGTVTANAAPAAGRVLYGTVDVRTDTNVLVGQGDVIVQSAS